jgi:hypothetical protein
MIEPWGTSRGTRKTVLVGSYAVLRVPGYNRMKMKVLRIVLGTFTRNTPELKGTQYQHGVQGVGSSNLLAPTNYLRVSRFWVRYTLGYTFLFAPDFGNEPDRPGWPKVSQCVPWRSSA